MISTLCRATLSQLRLRSATSPTPISHSKVDHLLSLTHGAHSAGVVSSPKQHFREVSVRRTRVSRFRAFMSAVALGFGFYFANSAAWAVCSGDTVVSAPITTTQSIVSPLCSFTVTAIGSISTTYASLLVYSPVTTINNTGSISTTANNAHGLLVYSPITTINNTGSGAISTPGTGAYNIRTFATITTLNNQQGRLGNSDRPLTYSGALPVNYNIIIAGENNYGQLSIANPTSTMVFGISGLSTTSSSIIGQSLSGVLQGFGSNLSTYISSGLTSSNGYTYSLTQQGSTGTWDLTITACSICTSGDGSSSGGAVVAPRPPTSPRAPQLA